MFYNWSSDTSGGNRLTTPADHLRAATIPTSDSPARAAGAGFGDRLTDWLLWLPLPQSIAGLALAGFCLVTLPLAAAVLLAVFYLDHLATRSQDLVIEGMQLTRRSEQLIEQLTDMERNARQYQILGDPALFKLYQEKHELFLARIDVLAQLANPEFNPDSFAVMRAQALAALALLQAQAGNGNTIADDAAPTARALAEHFATLQSRARALASFSNRRVDERLQALLTAANQADMKLFWLSSGLLPIALMFGGLFTVLITRPVRQLRAAIQHLGDGELEQTIDIAGPQDIRRVSRKLDWLRRRLLYLEEEKKRFLRHVSHELKTPLASIREGVELLADGTVGPLTPAQTEVAEIVRENSVELQLLIENLLNFSAWQQQRLSFGPRRQRLQPLLHELRDKYRLVLGSKRLTLSLPRTPVKVYADPDLLITALDNLLSNAVKFTPSGGCIRIVTGRDAQCVWIEVIDSGPGIAAANRERIFEPFFTSAAPTGTRLHGTGIGLSVTRECIQAHNGTIEVIDGQYPGAHFRITLPARG